MQRNPSRAPNPIETINRALRGASRAIEGSIDPIGMAAPIVHAQLAWASHPQELAEHMLNLSADLWKLQMHSLYRLFGFPHPDPIQLNPDDTRFADPWWTEVATWDITKEWYLAITHHMQDMLYATPGLDAKERRRAAFWWRKWLNAIAPTNFLLTNPVAIRKAIESNGESLRQGFVNMLADIEAGSVRMTRPDDFKVGKNLAYTPGAVVYRNRLLEVIHYAPSCERVHAEPIVIVTPWINKFYVLDLTEKKSLVRYLRDQGFDVFITSWKNPDASMADTRFDDYLIDGVHAIVETARGFCGADKVHAVGYCIGGTALSMYMAWANRRFALEEVPVRDFTLFTTLVDFQSPGDIEVFVDEASISFLESKMARKGYLDGKEMAASFRLLRSNSLIWHYVVHGWLYGETPPPFDVLFWNMDTTRMPRAMHSWYLRELYLHNNLVRKDALEVAGEKLDLSRVSQALYVVTAVDDHIAPWKQCYRINNHVTGEKRFVLSSSGHILGILNPPVDPPKRKYWVGDAHRSDRPEAWRADAEERAGTWWEDWMAWLKPRCGPLVEARPMSSPAYPSLADAPGEYVHEK